MLTVLKFLSSIGDLFKVGKVIYKAIKGMKYDHQLKKEIEDKNDQETQRNLQELLS